MCSSDLLEVEVYFIPGNDRNFKVTTKTDVKLAGYLLGAEGTDD